MRKVFPCLHETSLAESTHPGLPRPAATETVGRRLLQDDGVATHKEQHAAEAEFLAPAEVKRDVGQQHKDEESKIDELERRVANRAHDSRFLYGAILLSLIDFFFCFAVIAFRFCSGFFI